MQTRRPEHPSESRRASPSSTDSRAEGDTVCRACFRVHKGTGSRNPRRAVNSHTDRAVRRGRGGTRRTGSRHLQPSGGITGACRVTQTCEENQSREPLRGLSPRQMIGHWKASKGGAVGLTVRHRHLAGGLTDHRPTPGKITMAYKMEIKSKYGVDWWGQ
ncbi:hypothetical protein NDU88_005699 [Pleurodeles waltl]|uniref:Uncharacterized protein n=1 Tax=Pleurodeles waltl TaxID=8319 RepID=A0AAV7L3T4_PLEWA|nr:hypothetical protein NDU88_005699 [Pleurodeles waltl]